MLKTILLLVLMVDLMSCCCVPKQIEVNVEMTAAYAEKGNRTEETALKTFRQLHARAHYDAVNMKMAIEQGHMKSIQDYKNETFYAIDLRKQTCHIYPSRLSFPFICTDTWTKIDSLYYGDGSSRLLAGKYMCSQQKGQYMNVTMGEEKCSPILWQSIWDNVDGGMMMTVKTFSNLTEGIKDPAVFAPPLHCNKTTTVGEEWGVLGHFVRLAGKCFSVA